MASSERVVVTGVNKRIAKPAAAPPATAAGCVAWSHPISSDLLESHQISHRIPVEISHLVISSDLMRSHPISCFLFNCHTLGIFRSHGQPFQQNLRIRRGDSAVGQTLTNAQNGDLQSSPIFHNGKLDRSAAREIVKETEPLSSDGGRSAALRIGLDVLAAWRPARRAQTFKPSCLTLHFAAFLQQHDLLIELLRSVDDVR